jgi:hypothetical protein
VKFLEPVDGLVLAVEEDGTDGCPDVERRRARAQETTQAPIWINFESSKMKMSVHSSIGIVADA